MSLWLLLIVASLATYRLTRLVVKDTFPPVLWMRDHLVGGWRPMTSAELILARSEEAPFVVYGDLEDPDAELMRWTNCWGWVPDWLGDLLSCPWCASGWVSLAVVTAIAFTIGVPAPVLVWPAVWGAGSLIAAQRWS